MSEADFAACRRKLSERAALPAPALAGGCHIYGAGGFGRRIAAELRRLDYEVLGFIDRRAREVPSLDGLPCRHPDDLDPAAIAGTHYVHGLMNHYASSRAVAAWAAGQGFAALVFPGELQVLPGFRLDNYWLAPPGETLASLDALEALHAALADEASRILLTQLLAYRLGTDPRTHPAVDAAGIYRPDFLPVLAEPVTFVDGGAFTGDSLEALLAGGVRIRDWIAVEPDAGNKRALAETARRCRGSLPAYTLIQAGLSDRAGRVRFVEGGGEASRIAAGTDACAAGSDIEIVRLDDVAWRSGPTYIKLDIEGAEQDALRGMAEHLARRPILAVSV
ncbi:MAG TPA: FkbM family methyltransferase, partial [Methylobacterium sp.]|nr:FkbM family methyltransferase [Methylobacterium sp.]